MRQKLTEDERVERFTITLTRSQSDKAKEDSKKIFGRPNKSAYIGYLIERGNVDGKEGRNT